MDTVITILAELVEVIKTTILNKQSKIIHKK